MVHLIVTNHIDELIRDVLLGGLYTVIGIPIYQLCGASANIDISIEVCTYVHMSEVTQLRMYEELHQKYRDT